MDFLELLPTSRVLVFVSNLAREIPLAKARPRRTELANEVLLRAQHQDGVACRMLFRTYQQSVHALLYRMLARSHGVGIVEELSQETFLRVFRSLSKFDVERGARLSSWILTIATRLALNTLRRRPHEPLQTEVIGPSLASPVDRELAVIVADALLALPGPLRAAFLLREYHGLEYIEIAKALKTQVGTVKSRLSRARTKLRQSLSEYQ